MKAITDAMTMPTRGMHSGGTRIKVTMTRIYAVGSILRPKDAIMTTSGDMAVSRRRFMVWGTMMLGHSRGFLGKILSIA